MKVYTSYFANVRKLPEHIVPISIARYARYWKGLKYFPLAPDADTLKMPLEEYTDRFLTKLSKLSVETVILELGILSEGKDFALLCYEKPGDFCHRRLVAEWIEEKTGIKIEEYKAEKQEETKQPNLL
ncbi:DUF488 family protein, N3 subclade [Leptospira santarosai]|uniref:DUF488 domain-containing protein n=1 Tax=Leptospira santarosai TaxID=28183 RepID=A0AB73LKK1_9LEPT|nr:hypothetical protein [Leptospira santarosai]AVV51445.1 Uncharacterized protein XB17_02868 [Leptospira santarosai]EKR91055.1 hypothetical protein LEP1GSC163_3189 [Leptospira santarosai str. CBC379]EMJ45843.1 hypothetical protein LEP1GSC169_0051 [Leptospira santarosai str. HAI1349]ONF90220.1 hypothetical protein BWD14_19750 [Leptospira santarosai]